MSRATSRRSRRRTLLVRRELEGEGCQVARDQLSRLGQRFCRGDLTRARRSGQPEPQHHEPSKQSSPALASAQRDRATGRTASARSGSCSLERSSAGSGSPTSRASSSACRRRSRSFFCDRSFCCRADRRVVSRLDLVVEVVARDSEAELVNASTRILVPGLSRASEPGLVEPSGLDLAVVVADARSQDLRRLRRRLEADFTTTSITASSSPKRSLTRFAGTGSS